MVNGDNICCTKYGYLSIVCFLVSCLTKIRCRVRIEERLNRVSAFAGGSELGNRLRRTVSSDSRAGDSFSW